MTHQFDAIDYVHKLEEAGVPPRQAQVHAQTLANVFGELVTTADLVKVEHELKTEMNNLAAALHTRIDGLATRIDGLEAKWESEYKLMKWIVATNTAMVTAIMIKLMLM